jgi:Tol biopolymer transport system component
MSEFTDILERARKRFPAPDLPMERVIARGDRQARNQRIAAGALALALVVAGVGIVWSVVRNAGGVRPGGTPAPIVVPEPAGPCFEGDPCFDTDLFVVRADGSGLTRLREDPTREIANDWSGDGERIAFHRVEGESPETSSADIYTMAADGSDVRRITADPAIDAFPVFSLDGSRIAFASNREGSWDLFVMDADGSNVIRITDFDSGASPDELHPTWSPDGREIAFVRSVAPPGEQGQLWIASVDGSDARLLLDEPQVRFPAWSPDGTRIAFGWDAHGESRIGVLNLDTGRVTDLGPGDLPRWSPDASKLAISDPGGGIEIIDLADTSRTLIVGEGGGPIWSPAGEWIVFTGPA